MPAERNPVPVIGADKRRTRFTVANEHFFGPKPEIVCDGPLAACDRSLKESRFYLRASSCIKVAEYRGWNWSYRRILVTEEIRRQRLQLAI
jgi:hypothetical protein